MMIQLWNIAWPAGVVILVGLGITTVVQLIVKPIKKAAEQIGTVAVLSDRIDKVVSVMNVTAKNTVAMKEAFRENNMASRSICYALIKLGCNGDTERAMEHVNNAEDRLNERYDKVIEEALTIRGEA